jgi:hypothetical protein
MTSSYVDDILSAGYPSFVKHTEQTAKRFDCKEREFDIFRFIGMKFETIEDEFQIHHQSYTSRLKPLQTDTKFVEYRSPRQKLQ